MGRRAPVLALGFAAACAAVAGERLKMDFENGVAVEDEVTGRKAVMLRDGKPWPAGRTALPGPSLANPEIQYEGGTAAQRSARVVVDPVRAGNRMMEFRVDEPNVRSSGTDTRKSRVQMNLYGNEGAQEVYLSVRMFVYPEMDALRRFPRPFQWLTISEWWNDAPWTGEAHPFRITVNLQKTEPDPQAPLRFAVEAQAMRPGRSDFAGADLWRAVDSQGSVPIGQWLRLDYYFREGNAVSGRFALAITPDGGARRVVFDERRPTHHPDALRLDGLRHLNPIKLYTSAPLTEHLRSQGAALRLGWDDVTVQACSKPAPGLRSGCEAAWESG